MHVSLKSLYWPDAASIATALLIGKVAGCHSIDTSLAESKKSSVPGRRPFAARKAWSETLNSRICKLIGLIVLE